jgi:hypothetical protein
LCIGGLSACIASERDTVSRTDEAAPNSPSIYFVSTTGSDEHPGTQDSPWRSLAHAVGVVQPGDTVYVRGGTYVERLTLQTSGTKNSPITFSNYPGETPVLSGESLSLGDNDTQNALVVLQNVSYVRIEGFSIENYVSFDERMPSGIFVSGSGSGIEIVGCSVSGIATVYDSADTVSERNAHAIAVYGTDGDTPLDGIVIDGCDIFDNALGGSEAVALNGNVTNFSVTNNRVHDNDNIGIDFIGFEGAAPQNDRARNGICRGNTIWNITSADNPAYEGVACAGGIYVDGGKNIVIEANRVENCDIGIEAACEHFGFSTEQIVIRNNIITDCRALAGIAFGGYDALRGGAKSIKIYNNTLFDNTADILIQYHCQFQTNEICNNVFCLDEAIEGDAGNIHISGNFFGDPGFVDVSGGDFRLLKGSSAIDAGVLSDWCGDFDFSGGARVSGGAVDCGALEYTG